MENEVEARRDEPVRSAEDFPGRLDAVEAVHAVESFARENPHVALAAAAGVGFLLGGGLTPRLLGALGLFVTRTYLRDTIINALQGAVEEQTSTPSQ